MAWSEVCLIVDVKEWNAKSSQQARRRMVEPGVEPGLVPEYVRIVPTVARPSFGNMIMTRIC